MTKAQKNKKAHEIVEKLRAFLTEDRRIGLTYDKQNNSIILDNYAQFIELKKALAEYDGNEEEGSAVSGGQG